MRAANPRLIIARLPTAGFARRMLDLIRERTGIEVFEPKGSLPKVVRLLREGRIMERAWLLFCDSCWRDEWIGVHEFTPPPPMDS